MNYICVIIFLTAQHHDQTQTSIFGGSTCQIAGRNINNLRYTDDITLMAESEKELDSPDEDERGKWKRYCEIQH